MTSSKSARLWRRVDNAAKRKKRRDKAVRAYKAGEIPLCVEQIPGLFWVDGRDGWFFRSRQTIEGAISAFHPESHFVVWLIPASPEQAADAILRHAEEEAMWADRDSMPF